MTSSVSSLIAVLLAAPPATAPADVPPTLAARVREAVAAVWSVPAADVALTWGRIGSEPLPADGRVRLNGRGVDGWFIAVIDPDGGATRAVRVRAGVTDTVAVAARPLLAGAHLATGDLDYTPRVRWGAPRPGAIARPGAGWQIHRPLARGDLVASPAATPPSLIAAGDPVQLTWSRGGVQIALLGVALTDAYAGESVRARVDGRRAPVHGVATAPGQVALVGGTP